MKLKVITDGTAPGTHLVDAATGEPVQIDGATITADIAVNQPPDIESRVKTVNRLRAQADAIRKGIKTAPTPAPPPQPPNRCTLKLLADVEVEVAAACREPFEWINHPLAPQAT